MPLALMMKARGYDVSGSDRAYDQRQSTERFEFLKEQGIRLFPQDGSGITDDVDAVIVSSAVESTVPDYKAAVEQGIEVRPRAALLASLVNEAGTGVAIAGTSGKSTTTAMIGWILAAAGYDPSVVNGAVMKNFVSASQPFASVRVGSDRYVVAEADESDGSIELYRPHIAVLNNIGEDHKTLAELDSLFSAFLTRAEQAVVNLDDEKVASFSHPHRLTYSLNNGAADFFASDIELFPARVRFTVHYGARVAEVNLACPGKHNIANALAAVAAAVAMKIPFRKAVKALCSFQGIARRFDVLGQVRGIEIIDDFAHNPDKIGALLQHLRQFSGRLLILFQPHGYGPLRQMHEGLVASFAAYLQPEDHLYVTDPVYFGGTVDRSVGSETLTKALCGRGVRAHYVLTRDDAAKDIISQATEGDRVIVMGARDDSLSAFARSILTSLKESAAKTIL